MGLILCVYYIIYTVLQYIVKLTFEVLKITKLKKQNFAKRYPASNCYSAQLCAKCASVFPNGHKVNCS